MPAPVFTTSDRPGDILDSSGRWVAEQLGWKWVKGRAHAEVRAGQQLRQLGLQPSKWNRTGVATWVSTRVAVQDKGLHDWRAAHPAGTVWPASHTAPRTFVYNSLLVNIDSGLAEVECSGLRQSSPAPRSMGLDEFVAAFRERVLPVLELFESPARVARQLPVEWLGMVTVSTIEWALAGGDRDAAAALLRRHLQRPLKSKQPPEDLIYRLDQFRSGWNLAPGREGLPGPGVLVYSTKALGWLARVHNLPGPEALEATQCAT